MISGVRLYNSPDGFEAREPGPGEGLRLFRRVDFRGNDELPAGFLARESGRKRGRERTAARVRRGLPGLILAMIGLVIAVAVFDYLENSGEIHSGVRVGEVSLGGMEPAQAREKLQERASENLNLLELRGGDAEARIPAQEIGLRLDARESVQRAYSVGREGNVLARVRDRAAATLRMSRVEPAVEYRRPDLRAEVERLAARTEREPREAALNITGPDVGVDAGRDGYRLDADATLNNAESALGELRSVAKVSGETLEPRVTTAEAERAAGQAESAVGEPLVLESGGERWTISADRVAAALEASGEGEAILRRDALGAELSEALGTLEREPVEADLVSAERGSVEVQPGRSGTEVELQELLDRIEAGIFDGDHRYEVPVSEPEPEFTTAEAEAARPNTLIGEFETGYEVYEQPNRIENLKTASEAVDGTILAPGETFSFNAAAAPLSRYKPSEVIVNGRLGTALGGGLCQVASTLYMAANYAGLEIVERNPHYAELPYIRPGFDATVWFGSLDLKFRNNTGEHLLIEERVDEDSGEVVARVYGKPDDREVRMDSTKLSGSGDTTRWQATRKVIEGGEVVESGPISTDTYQDLQPGAPAPTGLGG